MKSATFLYLLLVPPLQEDDIPKLVDALRHPNIEVRERAVNRLIARGEEVCPRLLPYLADEDIDVRVAVRQVFLKTGATGLLLEAVLGRDGDVSEEAANLIHRLHAKHLPRKWEDKFDLVLARAPRRPVSFRQLQEDLLSAGIPLLVWPAETPLPAPRDRHQGTYKEILEKFAFANGWRHHASESGIVIYPESKAAEGGKLTLCHALIALLESEPAPSPLSILFADLGTKQLDEALIRRVEATEGFWRHARDILIYSEAKYRILSRPTPGALVVMEERLLHKSWPVRAAAAQALIDLKRLPAKKLLHEDPRVRYLSATIADRSRTHAPALNRLLKDRYRDIRTRALFASLHAAESADVDFDAVLEATDTAAGSDRIGAIKRLRELGSVERLGLAVVRRLDSKGKDLGFELIDVFKQNSVLKGVCETAKGEKEEKYQEKYLPLLGRSLASQAKTRVIEVLIVYFALPSQRVGGAASDLLVGLRVDEVRQTFEDNLSHALPGVRRRSVDAYYRWAMKRYGDDKEENDAIARVLEHRASEERDPEIKALARRHAAALRLRGSEPSALELVLKNFGGRYSARLGGKRNLVARGGGGSPGDGRGQTGWKPFVKITIPRPDLR